MSTTPWTAQRLQDAHRFAINCFCDGQAPAEIAPVVGASIRSVQRWIAAWTVGGDAALRPRPRPGRPAKLTDEQAEEVLDWLIASPVDFGFASERWTAPRVAALIKRDFGVHMNARYLNDWLRRRGGITPQVPERRAYERDQGRIDAWIERRWPRVKKKLAMRAPPWFSRTKVDFC